MLPFSIYLSYPNILVRVTNSQQNLIRTEITEFWAEVMQVNDLTTMCNVGDVVFYRTGNPLSFIYQPNTVEPGVTYLLLNENEILFREAVNDDITTESSDVILTEDSIKITVQ